MHKPLYNSRYNYGLGPLDPVLSTKISILRSQLMAAGIWAKLTDVFPLAGGVSTQGLNIRNRTNPLVFTNPDLATFSSLGYSPNGSGFGSCVAAPTVLDTFSLYFSIPTYSMSAVRDVIGHVTITPLIQSSFQPGAHLSYTDGNCYSDLMRYSTGRVSGSSSGNTSYTGTRLAGGNHRVYGNGNFLASAASNTDSLADINFWVLGTTSSRTYNFLAIGTELTALDVAVFDQIVKIYRA